MKKLFALAVLGLVSVSANAAGTYVLTVVNSYNPFSPSGTSVLSGPVPTAGTATVDGAGNVSATGIANSFVNVNSTYNYTNGVWTGVVGGTSITHTETCTESAGTPCSGAVSGLAGIWNSTQQSGGAATTPNCQASVAFPAGNCDRVSIVEDPGVSLTITEQSEFAIGTFPSGFIWRFTALAAAACADFAAQVTQDSSNNAIATASRCTDFAAAVTLSITTPPTSGTASVNGTDIVYTPNGGFVGTDTLTYQGTDGSATDSGVLTITVADVTPDSFAFNDQPNVAPSTLLTSNTITVAGITVPVAISVTGGQYSINGGAFTATAGTVSNGNTVAVQQTSSAVASTATNATLTIGGVADTFTVTTANGPPDTNPDQFRFVDQKDVAPGVEIVSAPVTISGINVATPISVTTGEYSIGCTGVFTSAPGTISDGETVCVRHTSAAVAGNGVFTTLTVGGAGGKSDDFISITRRSGGSSSMDAWVLGLLGLLVLGQRRRQARLSA